LISTNGMFQRIGAFETFLHGLGRVSLRDARHRFF